MRCYRCGKPATKFVNTAIGVAVTAASILESACDECWQKSHDAPLTAEIDRLNAVECLLIDDKVEADTRAFAATMKCFTLTAALEEARGALEDGKRSAESLRGYVSADFRASALAEQRVDNDIASIDAALATINAALGRVKG